MLSEEIESDKIGYDFRFDASVKAIAFTAFSDYRLNLSTDNKTAIFNKLKDMGHASLYEAIKSGKKTRVTGIMSAGASDESAWFEDEDASNLTKLLNADGILAPPMNNENKTRRVFWESDNGLHKYSITATLNLYMKAGWRGWKTEAYHWTDPAFFFSIPQPRLVNSIEIYPFTVFVINHGY